MDEIVYNALNRYYHVLEVKGYISYKETVKMFILLFYYEFIFKNYTKILSKDDYKLIEKALDCLWGSTCLIPYPDYLKMGKLHLGEMAEIMHRLKTLENTSVVKLLHDADTSDSDVVIVTEE